MYKNKGPDGKNNLCGERIKLYRIKLPGRPSQREFAAMLQVAGLDIDKNAVQRIESGSRYVTDIELKTLTRILRVSYEDLIGR